MISKPVVECLEKACSLLPSFFICCREIILWPTVDSDNPVFMSTDSVSTLCPFTQTWNTKPRLPWHHYSHSVCCLSLCLLFMLFSISSRHPFLLLFLQNTILSVRAWSSDISGVCVSYFISLLRFQAAYAACTSVSYSVYWSTRCRKPGPSLTSAAMDVSVCHSHKHALNGAFWTIFNPSCEC